MSAPKRSTTDGIGIRWAILAIATASHGAVIAALLNMHVRPASFIPPQVLAVQVLAVSVVANEAPAKEPAAESLQPERKPPVIKPNKSSLTPSSPAKAMLAPVAAEAPVTETGEAPPATVLAQSPAPSGTAGVEPTASPAGTAGAGPEPASPPRFDADYLSNLAPPYPSASRVMGEQGEVLLSVLVSPAGTVTEVRLRTGSGFERLDQAALDAVRRWKFVPARQGSEAVAAWVVVPILFSLRR